MSTFQRTKRLKLKVTRDSVVLVQSPIMTKSPIITKNQYLNLDSISGPTSTGQDVFFMAPQPPTQNSQKPSQELKVTHQLKAQKTLKATKTTPQHLRQQQHRKRPTKRPTE